MLIKFTILCWSIYANNVQHPLVQNKITQAKEEFYGVKFLQYNTHCSQISPVEQVQRNNKVDVNQPVVAFKSPAVRDHQVTGTFAILLSIIGLDPSLVEQEIQNHCDTIDRYIEYDLDALESEIEIEIIKSGDPKNRIDAVFMGDGYTKDEREKFILDMKRLVNDMWAGNTFESVLPLYNIWAVFVPSNEHGIGVGGKPKDTAFGLYRDGTELRGIYCSKQQRARQVCKATGKYACDYPTLIGNDPYYGGLGGEFVISTSSETSGTIVLRHEIGHSMIDVGEEYDGGQVYSGCNAAHSLSNIPWKEWLSEPDNVREETAAIRVQDYAWYDLANGDYEIKFHSDGKFDTWKMEISSSGVEVPDSLEVYFDGVRLPWETTGNLDRAFSAWEGKSLAKGQHALIFKQGFPPSTPESPIRQLCSVRLHEFANEPLFHKSHSFIGAFPTWDIYGRVSYRPTNDACLMRDMSRDTFCHVCTEGLWANLLSQLSLIDNVIQTCQNTIKIQVSTLPLAQFRTSIKRFNESLSINWFDGDHQPLDQYKDQFTIEVPGEYYSDEWLVEVKFWSSQIRGDYKQKYFDGLEEQVKLYRTIKEQEQEITKLSDQARDQQARTVGLQQAIRILLASSSTFGNKNVMQMSESDLYGLVNEILVNNHFPAIVLNRKPERRESINSDKVESSGSPIDISQLVSDNYPEPAKEKCTRCHTTNSSRWVKSDSELQSETVFVKPKSKREITKPSSNNRICQSCGADKTSKWYLNQEFKGTYLCNACYRRRNTKKKNEALMRERAGSC
ncbi:hypothetical protein HDV06_001576 [Boothiomyces sp. JEL0866]|nr:hypothetical protein HDV06_001576 [Boothiomyces sp. JEL0866]